MTKRINHECLDECYLCFSQERPFESAGSISNDIGGRTRVVRCWDRAACDARVQVNHRLDESEACDEIATEASYLRAARDEVKAREVVLQSLVRDAVGNGASVSKVARAAGLSRERVYQIRDGRR